MARKHEDGDKATSCVVCGQGYRVCRQIHPGEWTCYICKPKGSVVRVRSKDSLLLIPCGGGHRVIKKQLES